MTATKLTGNLLTISETAEAMKVCRTTVYQLMDAGLLQSVKIPGTRARRIPRQAIEQLLAAGLTGGGAA